jgi:Zn-dependent protease
MLTILVLGGPVTLWHEIGHAVAARRRVPGRVAIFVGIAPRRWRFALGGIEFAVSPLTAPLGPAGECVYEGWPTAGDAAVIAAAGPAATAAGLAVTLAAIKLAPGAIPPPVVAGSVLIQAFALVFNLVPLTYTHRGRAYPTDGRKLLDALRSRRSISRRAI